MNIKAIYDKLYFPVKITRKFHRDSVRKKIKNSDFTILSCNCMGGLIYHELGMKFTSPTINTMILSADFLKFVSNLDYYLEQELRFTSEPIHVNGERVTCPVAFLDDVMISFTHYKTDEESKIKWNERKKRINYDNMYVVFNDRDGVTIDDVKKVNWSRFKNVAVFTAKEYDDCDCAVYLKRYKKNDCVGNINEKDLLTGLRVYEKDFDYIGFLNSEKIPARKFIK